MKWTVLFSRQAAKQAKKQEKRVLLVLQLLVEDLRSKGPIPGKNWPNYGKLRTKKHEDKRHCHLIKGNPTYVCCWEVKKAEMIVYPLEMNMRISSVHFCTR